MKKNDIDDDMSKTFIAEVGQKSAIADDEEVLEKNTIESNFSDISIEPPKEEINTNEIGTNIEEKETKPRYEEESSMFDETKKKKSNPLLTVLLMILALGIGAGGSYYYFEVLNKEVVSTKVEEKEEVGKDTAEELKPDGLFVKNLIEDYDFYLISNVDVFNKLYANDKTEVSDIDEYYLRNLAATKARKILGNSDFSGESFTNAARTLFGSEVTLENKTFTDSKIEQQACYVYEYNKQDDYYYLKRPSECGGASTISMERKIVKAIKKEDSLEIAVAVALVDTATDKVYKKIDATITDSSQLTDEVEDATTQTFDIDKDYSKLNQYQYTFKYDKDNSNYYLESIELIK